jgi:hypothetical protein
VFRAQYELLARLIVIEFRQWFDKFGLDRLSRLHRRKKFETFSESSSEDASVLDWRTVNLSNLPNRLLVQRQSQSPEAENEIGHKIRNSPWRSGPLITKRDYVLIES